MIIVLILCVFMLPLSAADSPKNKQISRGELLCELAIRNGMIAPDELKRFPCISQYINVEASKKLDGHRLALKNYVEQFYPATDCEVTYSRNKLEAAIIEDTDIFDFEKREKLATFWYVYFKNEKDIKARFINYEKSDRRITYKPFFTKTHACFDFGTDITMTMIYETGLCWNRITKNTEDSMTTRFFVWCENRYLPTGYFARVLPDLYAKIMKKSASFVYERSIIFYQPPKPGRNRARWASGPAFTIDLVQTDILTENDVSFLSTFLPNGKYQKWFDIPKKHGYALLNVLACYGSPRTLLDEIDNQVGKYKTKWKGLGNVHASHCIEYVEVLLGKAGEYISFTEDNIFQRLSATARATLDYIVQLKKEGVFFEKDWNNGIDLKKRIKLYNQAIQFLRHKRMTWLVKDKHHLIRYDRLSNMVALFKYGAAYGANLTKIVEQKVSSTIDLNSIQIIFVSTGKNTVNPTITYQLLTPVKNDSESESSDVLVESSDE